jgi:seryl-tRNA synthetase
LSTFEQQQRALKLQKKRQELEKQHMPFQPTINPISKLVGKAHTIEELAQNKKNTNQLLADDPWALTRTNPKKLEITQTQQVAPQQAAEEHLYQRNPIKHKDVNKINRSQRNREARNKGNL